MFDPCRTALARSDSRGRNGGDKILIFADLGVKVIMSLGVLTGTHGVLTLTDDQKPTVPYWHLYTDENGVSRQRRCLMTRFELKSMQPPADPQWQGPRYHDGMTTMVTVQPVGWVGTWHENPAPQWIIPLSGRWWVESMDGERVEMGPGHISFGEDQGCIPHNGRIGHRSGTIGTEPAVLMVVQFDTRRAHTAPCRFE